MKEKEESQRKIDNKLKILHHGELPRFSLPKLQQLIDESFHYLNPLVFQNVMT
jgi:hypothetical protein